MKVFSRGMGLAVGALALMFAGAAGAQESLDSGKTPAQLFASDCAICHKTPQGINKSGRLLGLEGFLREHYTASRESAAAIAAYLQAMDRGAPAPAKPAKKMGAKPDDKTKGADKKSATGKPGDAKAGDAKAGDAKPADAKPAEAKPSEAKPSEAKPADAKPSEAKPADPKPAESPKSD